MIPKGFTVYLVRLFKSEAVSDFIVKSREAFYYSQPFFNYCVFLRGVEEVGCSMATNGLGLLR